jgi:6,7-dimethyl-8-ribityllumazine synthase
VPSSRNGKPNGKADNGLRIAIVVSRFNDFITERLLAGAEETIREAGVAGNDLIVLRVPGAFEIPIAAQRLAETSRVDAVICLGCLIRGATPHFEYIASACAHGITAAAAATGVPMTFGVLTTNSVEEALERAAAGDANKGREAALAAIELVRTLQTLDDARR